MHTSALISPQIDQNRTDQQPKAPAQDKQPSVQRFALEMVMEPFAELMRRLLEIQSGGRQRNPELIAEDANGQQYPLEKSGEDGHAGADLIKLDRNVRSTGHSGIFASALFVAF